MSRIKKLPPRPLAVPQTDAIQYDADRAKIWREFHPTPISDSFYNYGALLLFLLIVAFLFLAHVLSGIQARLSFSLAEIAFLGIESWAVIASVEAIIRTFRLVDPSRKTRKSNKPTNKELANEYRLALQSVIASFSAKLQLADNSDPIFRDEMVRDYQMKYKLATGFITFFGALVTPGFGPKIVAFFKPKNEDATKWIIDTYTTYSTPIDVVSGIALLLLLYAIWYRFRVGHILNVARRP